MDNGVSLVCTFVCRLGLGAEISVSTAPPRIVTDSKVWQSVSGKRKSHHPSRSVPTGNKLQADRYIVKSV